MIEQSYDDRDGWIWMDGKLVPWERATIHVSTHGFLYGTAVFEGVRAYWDGKQFLSRLGNVYHAPAWFVAGLPAVPLPLPPR